MFGFTNLLHSFLEDKIEPIRFEGESDVITVNVPGFKGYHEYLRSVLYPHGEGVFATQIIQIGLSRTGVKTIVDVTGENKDFEGITYFFDVMDDPNRIRLPIEVKSVWELRGWDQNDLLEAARNDLLKHADESKKPGKLVSNHGYAVAIIILPTEIRIYWKEVPFGG